MYNFKVKTLYIKNNIKCIEKATWSGDLGQIISDDADLWPSCPYGKLAKLKKTEQLLLKEGSSWYLHRHVLDLKVCPNNKQASVPSIPRTGQSQNIYTNHISSEVYTVYLFLHILVSPHLVLDFNLHTTYFLLMHWYTDIPVTCYSTLLFC